MYIVYRHAGYYSLFTDFNKKFLLESLERKRSFGKPKYRCNYVIKTYLNEIGWEGIDLFLKFLRQRSAFLHVPEGTAES